jgi:large subunit ribosomal protein L30
MSKSNEKTIRIRWIRSGIAFNRNQKEIVRSLGLRRLHQVVERVDNPAVRGLVAKVAHLVEIIDGPDGAVRPSVPEYTISRPEPAEAGLPKGEPASADIESESAESHSGSSL